MLINGTKINSVSTYSSAVNYTEGDIVIVDINGVSKMYRVNNQISGVPPSESDENYSLYAKTDDNIISGSEYLSGQKTFNDPLEVARYMVSHRFCIIRVPSNFLPGYGYEDPSRFGFEPTLSNPNDDLSDFIIVSTDDGRKAYAMEVNGKIALITSFQSGNSYTTGDNETIEVANFNNSEVTKTLTVDGGTFVQLENYWGLTNLQFVHSDEDIVSQGDIKCIVRIYPDSLTELNDRDLKVIKVFVEYTFSNSDQPDGRAPYQESIPLFINHPANFIVGRKFQSDGIFCKIECDVLMDDNEENYYHIQATKLSPSGGIDPAPHPYENLNKIEIVGIVGLTSM